MWLPVLLLLAFLPWAECRQQRNTWTQELGNVSYVSSGLTDTLADYVTRLGTAVEPSWKANLTANLAKAGVTIVNTERIIIVPNIILFPPATFFTTFPKTGADWARFLANPALFAATSTTVIPLALWNRLQIYWASDAIAGIQMPYSTGGVGAVPGTGTRGAAGRRLRSAAHLPPPQSAERAALSAQLMERVMGEAPALISRLELQLQDNRSFVSASLGVMAHALSSKLSTWSDLLSLTVSAQASVFAAQFADVRVGVSATVTDAPSAQVTAFSRIGFEFDADASTSLRLVPEPQLAAAIVAEFNHAPPPSPPRQPSFPPPPSPPPPPLSWVVEVAQLLYPNGHIALTIIANQLLSPTLCDALTMFLLSFQSAATPEQASKLAPLLAQLRLDCALTSTSIVLLVAPAINLITGQVTINVPDTAVQIAAALRAPSLQPLLQTSVSFSASALFTVSLVFTEASVQQGTPLLQLGKRHRQRRLLAGQPPPEPGSWLASAAEFLAVANASVASKDLVARATLLAFDTISATLWIGRVERQTLRKDSVLNRTALKFGSPWWLGLSHGSLFDVSERAVFGGASFVSFGVSVSANEALTVLVAEKGSPSSAVRAQTGTGTRG